jgi:hypothetical protein
VARAKGGDAGQAMSAVHIGPKHAQNRSTATPKLSLTSGPNRVIVEQLTNMVMVDIDAVHRQIHKSRDF